MHGVSVKGLQLPPLLLDLLRGGRWRHPGDEALACVIPFLREPVDFLTTVDQIRRESSSRLAEDPGTSALFREVLGSTLAAPTELPWLDAELAVFVAVNREPGADIGVALDYRGDREDPRVVASDWWSEPGRCRWREVAPTFSAFVARLGLL